MKYYYCSGKLEVLQRLLKKDRQQFLPKILFLNEYL